MRSEDLMSWSTNNTASELLALAATIKGEKAQARCSARIYSGRREESVPGDRAPWSTDGGFAGIGGWTDFAVLIQ